MCSTANHVLPLRRMCEVFATPGRLCGGAVPMTTHFPGARSYGTPQDTEMDLAWQELMAFSELQELEAPGDIYETQYHPVAPGGEYSVSHSEPPQAACEPNVGNAYGGCYSEEAPVCQRLSNNAEAMCGHFQSQLNQRMPPVSTQTSFKALREQMNVPSIEHRHRRPNVCPSQGLSRHTWPAHGQTCHARSGDDLESDSGLSLGSSPPLASPDNAIGGTTGYQSMDMEARETQNNFSMDFQSHPHLHSGAQPYFSQQPNSSHTQPNLLLLQAAREWGQATTVNDPYGDPGVSSRGRLQHSMYTKPPSAIPAPLSKDERRAVALKIPFPMDKIINLPVDDFNELLSQYALTDSQLTLVRDIRRRGKNKVAAQNCRKRKLEGIIHLERELSQLQAQREHLVQQRLEFQRSLAFIQHHLADLYTEVFSHLRDEEGQPYSIDEYSLQQAPDGSIYLVPLTSMQKK
ncbi:transcription factor NF-E2 45 kDa subunit [Thalassophryne amazonica]|uniref:transcription factor NF-E2 45 kDa subunit n=1 Tax=Thalassophryne amazonica TaxID=390379 RepID=UPI001470D643|nr:transcription factor NF-E2 45 kDa subunit [Thalassophryne amazonica]